MAPTTALALTLLALYLVGPIHIHAQPVASYIMKFKDVAQTICTGTQTPVFSSSSLTDSPDDSRDSDSMDPNGSSSNDPTFLYVGSKANFGGKHKCVNDNQMTYYFYDPLSTTFTPLATDKRGNPTAIPPAVLNNTFIVSVASSPTLNVSVLNQASDPLNILGVNPSITVPPSSAVTSQIVQVANAGSPPDVVTAFANYVSNQNGGNLKGAIIISSVGPSPSGFTWSATYVAYTQKKNCKASGGPCMNIIFTSAMVVDPTVSGLARRKKRAAAARKLFQRTVTSASLGTSCSVMPCPNNHAVLCMYCR